MTLERAWIGIPLICLAFLSISFSALAPYFTAPRHLRPATVVFWTSLIQLVLVWSHVSWLLTGLGSSTPSFHAWYTTFFALSASFQFDRIFDDASHAWLPYTWVWIWGVCHEILQVVLQLFSDSWSIADLAFASAKFLTFAILLLCFNAGRKDGYDYLPPDAEAHESGRPFAESADINAASNAASLETRRAEDEVMELGFWPWIYRFKVFKDFFWPADRQSLRLWFIVVFVLRLVQKAIRTWRTFALARFIDKLQESSTWHDIYPSMLLWVLLHLSLSSVALPRLDQYLWLLVMNSRREMVVIKVYNTIMGAGSSYHNSADPANIQTASQRATTIDTTFDDLLLQFIPSIFAVFLAISVILLYFEAAMLDLMICLTLVTIIFRRFTAPLMETRKQIIRSDEHQKQQHLDTIRGWRTAANYNQLGYQVDANQRRNTDFYSKKRKFLTHYFKAETLSSAILVLGFFVGVLSVIRRILAGVLKAGDFIAYQLYWDQILEPFTLIQTTMRTIVSNFQDADHLRKLLESATEAERIENTRRGKSLNFSAGEVEFRDVNFGYGDTPVLVNFNLQIRAGKTCAVVGSSGTGKSTLMNLLTRHQEPDSGRIMIDNQDIADIAADSLRKYVGVLEQNPHIFNVSAMDNVRYANRDATSDQVQEACCMACIHDDIIRLPQGYDTNVGVDGKIFSGGQKQRLALARLFLQQPAIVLIDEGTSALDAETESFIKNNIKEVFKGKTQLIIAHRLSSIMHADTIIVLGAKGAIVQQGKHNELIKDKNGPYSRSWQRHVGAT